jgi:2-keto-4-pentenoate hydratase/2-oxohepta-3-ene-1,7-dioic acid hydratase in catechol pathway
MKLITFDQPGEQPGRLSYGAVVGERVVDLGARLGRDAPTLGDLIANELLGKARVLAAKHQGDHAFAGLKLKRPLPQPGKILCVGINYQDRNTEYRDGMEVPKYPSLFVRFPESFVAHNEPILRPPESRQFDYEGEIVLVIGTRGRRIARAEAMSHVMGYTIANEGSVRDWLRHGKFNVTQGKNFEQSGAIGPWIVTADHMPAGPLTVRTRVNGEERQNDTTARLLFPFDHLVSYISTFCTLEPGDIILTGTPNGAGARFDPPKWLVPGDVVEVEVSGIGVLSNPVADEKS